ncbi:uncharacterized protein [Ptychodera flava]|uniref:uncharacterized protein n=1 Tax=Ptychodera flava TaxID=63121 RepID=UPI003969F531
MAMESRDKALYAQVVANTQNTKGKEDKCQVLPIFLKQSDVVPRESDHWLQGEEVLAAIAEVVTIDSLGAKCRKCSRDGHLARDCQANRKVAADDLLTRQPQKQVDDGPAEAEKEAEKEKTTKTVTQKSSDRKAQSSILAFLRESKENQSEIATSLENQQNDQGETDIDDGDATDVSGEDERYNTSREEVSELSAESPRLITSTAVKTTDKKKKRKRRRKLRY